MPARSVSPWALALEASTRDSGQRLITHFRRQAQLCVLVETCTEKEYVKLVEALCSEHNIHLIKVSNAEKLGEWAGLCKIDREGNPRKVVKCSCVVVKEIEESPAWQILLESFSQ